MVLGKLNEYINYIFFGNNYKQVNLQITPELLKETKENLRKTNFNDNKEEIKKLVEGNVENKKLFFENLTLQNENLNIDQNIRNFKNINNDIENNSINNQSETESITEEIEYSDSCSDSTTCTDKTSEDSDSCSDKTSEDSDSYNSE